MFQATLGHRDPEAWVRWTIAGAGLFGLALNVAHSLLSYYVFSIIRYAMAFLWFVLFGGAAPALPPMYQPPPPPVFELALDEPVRDVPEWDGADLEEPEALIGEAPAARDPAEEPVFDLRRGVVARDELRREEPKTLLAVLGTSAMSDSSGLFSGIESGNLDGFDSLGTGGLEGLTLSSGSGGLGLVGSGGGGRGEGLGGLGSRGSVGMGGGGTGGGVGVIGAGSGSGRRVFGVLRGDAAGRGPVTCVVQVQPSESEPELRYRVEGCEAWAHDDARSALSRSVYGRRSGEVRVTLR